MNYVFVIAILLVTHLSFVLGFYVFVMQNAEWESPVIVSGARQNMPPIYVQMLLDNCYTIFTCLHTLVEMFMKKSVIAIIVIFWLTYSCLKSKFVFLLLACSAPVCL